MSTTQGYIVIRQAILRPVTEQETEAAIIKANAAVKHCTFKQVAFTSVTNKTIAHTDIKNIQWETEARNHQQIFKQELSPLLEKYPDYKVVYFGAAPVALATYLGSLIGTWRKTSVFLLNHQGEKEWYLNAPSGQEKEEDKKEELIIQSKGIPQEENNTTEDIAITVATSYPVDQTVLKDAVASNLAKQISLFLEPLILDIPDIDLLQKMSDQFGSTLNQVAKNLQHIETIHLVSGVPAGLAFLLGTNISANIQPTIQLYQYDKSEENPYIPVLKIGQSLEEVLVLDEEQKQLILEEKQIFEKEEWKKIQNWLENKEEEEGHWLKYWKGDLKEAKKHFNYYFWKDLPALHQTPLPGSFFSVEETIVDFNFVEEEETWEIGETLWFRIREGFESDQPQLFRAIRLFIFHEGMHYWKHNLKGITAEGIGRFPKILEQADYQSDVWAMWQEYFYSKQYHFKDIDKEKPSKFFLQLIDNALATMWAFDETGGELTDLQIRRVNRYLIWYWQRLRLEDKRCETLADIAAVLAEMPVLELKGLATKVEGPRVFYQLDRLPHNTNINNNLELGIWWKNSIHRIGSIDSFNIRSLIKAFRKRASGEILQLLKAAYSGVVR